MVKKETLKGVIEDAHTRYQLYKNVFTTKEGELLLAYMEYIYKGKPDLSNNNLTYYNLGKKEVINQIKLILDKESK